MNGGGLFQQFIKTKIKKELSEIRPGWTVKVHQKIKEGDKLRTQVFEGMVIARKHRSELGATITVRKVVGGFGVEKIFPLHLPTIEKIEVIKKTKARRAKLYYLRRKSAREIRRKIKTVALSARVEETTQKQSTPTTEENKE